MGRIKTTCPVLIFDSHWFSLGIYSVLFSTSIHVATRKTIFSLVHSSMHNKVRLGRHYYRSQHHNIRLGQERI